jgi:hypothetical protein
MSASTLRLTAALSVALCSAAAPALAQVYQGLPGDRAAWLAGIGASPSITETFETVPVAKDNPVASFSQAGVTYTGLAGGPFGNVLVASPGYTNFSPAISPTTSSVLVANGDEHFLITFATPQLALAMDVYTNGLGPLTIEFFNGASSLGSASWDGSADTIRFLGFATAALPVTSMSFTSTNGGLLNTGLDNIALIPVPEPASAVLLLGGLAALTGLRRRRDG